MKHLITKWSDLESICVEGDRLAILVSDRKTGKMKFIMASIFGVYPEDSYDYEEEYGSFNL